MVLDINTINSINDAKNADYAGEKLGDADKAIFVDTKLKNPDGSENIGKIRKISKLLDEVKRAKKLTKKDIVLLGNLEAAVAETGTDTPYKMINAVDAQIDSAITALKALPEDGDNSTEIAEAKKLLKGIQSVILAKEETQKEVLKELERFNKDTAYKNKQEVLRLRKLKDNVEARKELVKKDINAKKILDQIIKLAKEYTEWNYYGDNQHKSNISVTNKKFLAWRGMSDVAITFAAIVKEISKEELKKSGISQKGLEAFENIEKIVFNKNYRGKWFEESFGKDTTTGEEFADLDEENMLNGGYEKKENWPNSSFQLKDLFIFMEEVFPETDYSNKVGDYVNKDKDKHIKGRNNVSILDKEYEIIWDGSELNPHKVISQYAEPSDFKFSPRPERIKVKWGDGSLVRTFYEVFHSERGRNFKVKKMMDENGDLIETNVTEIQSKAIFARDYNIWTQICANNYVEAVRNIVGDEIDGSEVDFEGDGWGRIARKVAMTAALTKKHFSAKIMGLSRKQKISKFEIVSSLSLISPSNYELKPDENYDYKNYDIDLWDTIVSQVEAKLSLAEVYTEIDKDEIAKIRGRIRAIEAEIRQEKEKEKVAKQALQDAEGKDLNKLKQEFDVIYGEGPTKKKYSWIEILKMNSKLKSIKAKSSGSLDSKYSGYQQEIQKIVNSLGGAGNIDLTKWMAMSGSAKERMDLIGLSTPEEVKNYYEKIRDALLANEKIAGLSPIEQEQLTQIKAILEEETPQDTPFSFPELITVLKGKTTETNENVYHFNDWKQTTNFKVKGDIEKLINSVCETDGNVKETFKDHLAAHDSWEITKIAKDADQWEKFIKNKPEHIIAAIKLFTEYEEKDAPAKKVITDEMEAKNNEANAHPTDKWNTTDEKDISQYLYRVAEGQTGDQLLKAKKSQAPNEGPKKDNEEKGWLRPGNWQVWAVFVGVPLIVGGIAFYFFWEQISNWWNGPMEEGSGEVEKTDEEENE